LTKQATIAYSIDTRPPNRSGEATRSDEREEDEARRGIAAVRQRPTCQRMPLSGPNI